MARFFFVIVLCLSSSFAIAQESFQEEIRKIGEAMKAIDVGVPEELDVDGLAKLISQSRLAQRQMSENFREFMIRTNETQQQAASKLLDAGMELDDDVFAITADIALASRIESMNASTSKEQLQRLKRLVERHLQLPNERGFSATSLSNATNLASSFERLRHYELARDSFNTFARIIRESEDPKYLKPLRRFEDGARRLELLGQSIEITGMCLDGKPLDWESYRGKVTLVDFWATWCGPCLAEAPNVRRLYERYHSYGFDVVAISLDRSREPLDKYIEANNVPWANLYADGKGGAHPMATKFNVQSIPTAYLVDREGKVISLAARGRELERLLAEEIGPKTIDVREAVLNQEWEQAAEKIRSFVEREPLNMAYRIAHAAIEATAGDQESFEAICEQTLPIAQQSNIWARARYVWLCGLRKQSGQDPQLIDKMASEILSQNSNTSMLLAKSLSSLRLNNYRAAIENAPTHGDSLQMACSYFIQSISYAALDESARSKECFDNGYQIVEADYRDLRGKKLGNHMFDHWVCCLVAQLLEEEAKQALAE